MEAIRNIELPAGITGDEATGQTIALLSSGGDARIVLTPETGLNRYLSSPYPRDIIAYASSTANDTSRDAFDWVAGKVRTGLPPYAEGLDALRDRIRASYGIEDSCEIVFAASGTDLEYVALAAVAGRGANGLHNILLGADEVGSGCIHSANGNYFAEQTPLDCPSVAGSPVRGLEQVSMVDVPVRTEEGHARPAREIADAIDREVAAAVADGNHALVHVVHGSKTGLVLPDLDGIDRLAARWGDQVSFVVDACQARITSQALRDYLERGAMVFLTGSKFMGGPPFNGFALVPEILRKRAGTLPAGLATIFRRAEWPVAWPGREILPEGENPGLLLRYEASVFELERFQRMPMPEVERVIDAFENAIQAMIIEPLGVALVRPFADGAGEEAATHPIEMRTLATIDVSHLPASGTFDDVQQLHRKMALDGIRLGQPVKCVRRPDGTWGGTLRIGLSMPHVVALAALDDAELSRRLHADMGRIASAVTG